MKRWDAHNRAEVKILETQPKRYLVSEYDSDDLNWAYTTETLAEAEELINAGTSRDVAVYDLDTGQEFRVFYSARIEQK